MHVEDEDLSMLFEDTSAEDKFVEDVDLSMHVEDIINEDEFVEDMHLHGSEPDKDITAKALFPTEEYLPNLNEISDDEVLHGDKFGVSQIEFNIAVTTPLAGVNSRIFRMPDPEENRLEGAAMVFCPIEVYEYDMITTAGEIQANPEGHLHIYHHHVNQTTWIPLAKSTVKASGVILSLHLLLWKAVLILSKFVSTHTHLEAST